MKFSIILKKLQNNLSAEEEEIFQQWYKSSPNHRRFFIKVSTFISNRYEPVNKEKAFGEIKHKIQRNSRRGYRHLAVAAIIVGIVGISVFLNFVQDKTIYTFPNSESVTSTPIQIGEDKATLTLGNGEEIRLSGKSFKKSFIKSNGKQITYTPLLNEPQKKVEYHYLTVPRGGQFFITLADSTQVWLNSDSQLKYPTHFSSGDKREVQLVYGEAYFKVSPSSEHQGKSFVVITQDQAIKVLGTEFNVNAYKENNVVQTTLIEGKVHLTNTETQEEVSLSPNEQAVLDKQTNRWTVSEVDPYDIIGWKEGFFRFTNTSLEKIMQILSRWYDIELIFKNEEIKKKKFNGVFSKKQKLENILRSIEVTDEASFKIDGKKVIVLEKK